MAASSAAATATATATSCHVLLFLRSQPPSPSPSPSPSPFISFLKPFFLSSSNATLSIRRLHPPLRKTLFASFFSTSSSSRALPHAPPLAALVVGSPHKFKEEDAAEEHEEEEEAVVVTEGELKTEIQGDSTLSPLERKREERLKLELELPSLSVKERKELGSFAHSLGKKLKTQLVGKSGVTPNLVTSFSDTLEANELLKIKIHRSCPGELDDVVKQLEEATSSVTVGQIGRTLILYRPSLSKLKAEEKKKQVRKLFLEKQRRRLKLNTRNEQVPNSSRRGSSWKARGRDSSPSNEQVPNSSKRGSLWKARGRDSGPSNEQVPNSSRQGSSWKARGRDSSPRP